MNINDFENDYWLYEFVISHECGDIHISYDKITYLPMARIAPQTQIIHNSASRNWNKIVSMQT